MHNPTQQEIRRVADLLARAYPYIRQRKEGEGVLAEPPLASLVRTILSQNTTDRNRDVAFVALRARYPEWAAVAEAPTGELAEVIHVTNYAYTKAGRIQNILHTLYQEHGAYTLDFLNEWPTERILDYLKSFPGVGEKSAAIVCLFSLGRPVIPVDTHVYRVTQRLGWISEKTSPERAHAMLQALIPPDLIMPLHMGLWEHGRLTCRPAPRCAQCAIYAFCIFSAKTAPEPPVEQAIAITSQQ
ncbi:MAG: endonuclease III domain-containing protein [Armatimonadota bacterium]